ncbi:MAG: precorrin-4 C(11)-methyltransferase [Prevotella sp.]|nr:precorrin-4 C(11)-methyltransferase [Prevotella sp.]
MQKIAIIPIGEGGLRVAAVIRENYTCETLQRTDVAARWHDYDAFVFIGAMGICVRTIAPCVSDKHTDPAVVCIDTLGRHVVSVLSGHVGGANDLTERLAAALGAVPVVTTQSDNAGLWALDTLDRQFGWTADTGRWQMNDIVIPFVNGKPTALLIEATDAGTDSLLQTLPAHVRCIGSIDELADAQVLIVVSPRVHDLPTTVPTIQFIPKVLTAGFGLAHHPADYRAIYDEMRAELHRQGLHAQAIREWCTIDVKADEPFIGELRQRAQSVRFFTADELSPVDVPTPSATVARHVGTPSVSEAAAILGSGNNQLILNKVKGKNWTLAISSTKTIYSPPSQGGAGGGSLESPFIDIVGAGPGDPDLISVRGRRLLEQADLILYAGSLVPRELTDCHKPGAVVRSSASMALEEQCQLMKEFYDQGKRIVRLHTGDPCIFGAIQEQMAFFDEHHMRYHITPGISSFLAAAAELRSQFTIPERTQTIILTRGEGRTPMPEREQLHLLARSQSTMCIFLSAAIVDDVQRQLLMEYPPTTPVAACYHLTWPDQRIYRGVLSDLARIVHDNHLTLTTMLVVGEAIDNRHGLSELYNRHFTHLFRQGEN